MQRTIGTWEVTQPKINPCQLGWQIGNRMRLQILNTFYIRLLRLVFQSLNPMTLDWRSTIATIRSMENSRSIRLNCIRYLCPIHGVYLAVALTMSQRTWSLSRLHFKCHFKIKLLIAYKWIQILNWTLSFMTCCKTKIWATISLILSSQDGCQANSLMICLRLIMHMQIE